MQDLWVFDRIVTGGLELLGRGGISSHVEEGFQWFSFLLTENLAGRSSDILSSFSRVMVDHLRGSKNANHLQLVFSTLMLGGKCSW